MEWTGATRSWASAAARLEARFPQIDGSALAHPPERLETLAQHVAERHELTLYEARDAVEQTLFGDKIDYQIKRMAG